MNWALVLVLVVIVAVLAVVVVILLRQRRGPKAPVKQEPGAPRDPFGQSFGTSGDPRELKAGDMIEYLGQQSWIRGSLRFSEGGSTWSEHFLELDSQKHWLSVEEEPDIEIFLWTPWPATDLTPHDSTLEVEGVTYRLDERGSAAYRSEGTTGLREQGGMDYADYAAADGRRLSFERFDHGRWEASTATSVANGAITIYPGS